MEADEVSDLELLASAVQEAMDAHRQGLIVGPPVDEVAFRRARRRALRRDAARSLRVAPAGDAA